MTETIVPDENARGVENVVNLDAAKDAGITRKPSPSKSRLKTEKIVKIPASIRKRDETPGRRVSSRELNQIVPVPEEDEDDEELTSQSGLLCRLVLGFVFLTFIVVTTVYVRERGVPQFRYEDMEILMKNPPSFDEVRAATTQAVEDLKDAVTTASNDVYGYVSVNGAEIVEDVKNLSTNIVEVVTTTDYQAKANEMVEAVKSFDVDAAKESATASFKHAAEVGTKYYDQAVVEAMMLPTTLKTSWNWTREHVIQLVDAVNGPTKKQEEVPQQAKSEPQKTEKKMEKKVEPKKSSKKPAKEDL